MKKVFILHRFERGTRPLLTPHDGRRNNGLSEFTLLPIENENTVQFQTILLGLGTNSIFFIDHITIGGKIYRRFTLSSLTATDWRA